jgi:hypothetical protein
VVAVLYSERELRKLFTPAHFLGLLLMSGIFAAWAVPYWNAISDADVAKQWSVQLTGRLTGDDFKLENWLMNLPRGLAYFLPWTLGLPLIAKTEWNSDADRRLAYALGWGALVPFVVVNLLPGGLPRYSLPALVPACWLMAMIFAAKKVSWGRKAWEGAAQRVNNRYAEWPHHHGWTGEWSLHDGYGPYQMMWVEPGRDPQWDIAVSIRGSYRRNLKILRGDYPKPYALFGDQWMIPHWETGAPGMAVCAEAVRSGKLKDIETPDGEVRKLFAQGQIPNHGVMGRASAAGYLKRAATELAKRSLNAEAVRAASDFMSQSSDLFRLLRYEEDLMKAGDLLARIADTELKALAEMERGWEIVQQLPRESAAWKIAKVA